MYADTSEPAYVMTLGGEHGIEEDGEDGVFMEVVTAVVKGQTEQKEYRLGGFQNEVELLRPVNRRPRSGSLYISEEDKAYFEYLNRCDILDFTADFQQGQLTP